MMRLLVLCCLPLAGCSFLQELSEAVGSAPPADPAAGQGSTHLPTVGGTDPLDLVVTALTLIGIPAAARLVMAARPILSPLLRLVLGKFSRSTPPAQQQKPDDQAS
jgi:hypothetical protein